jgi:hypothetical protein
VARAEKVLGKDTKIAYVKLLSGNFEAEDGRRWPRA